ncbi:MAG: alkane 1-monooxygenase [Gammaproteobacteria bacterium]|nr:MAG: alkane 1-monooxygenase [Gammaproteobacteria bacterium]RLA15763.1 MAG: alkane 1-monooxygenase [Gammaproteobacteria bacterium]RLA17286.1 MAG: alkane 1-monooxygenase [Gammaproteobacteria bacterium]
MIPLSVLDLSPVIEGGDASDSLRNSLDLAQHVEKWGFNRYWVAEHHGMTGIASAATSVVIGHIAAGTSTMRVGAGGIMLPNHSPLVIAEQFGTLESLFPGRIDLGLGRAPGTDQATAQALRRDLNTSSERFPQDVMELMAYFQPAEPGQRVRAVPGAGTNVPVWILGSSLFGAQLAAELGLPYSFASHFAPGQMLDAIKVYRERFKPSVYLAKPYVMMGFSVFAADVEEDAQFLASSWQQAMIALRTGRPGKLPPPVAGFLESLNPMQRSMVQDSITCAAIGNPEQVHEQLSAFVEKTGADELIITSQSYHHSARLRSYEIVAEVATMAHSQ